MNYKYLLLCTLVLRCITDTIESTNPIDTRYTVCVNYNKIYKRNGYTNGIWQYTKESDEFTEAHIEKEEVSNGAIEE